MARVVRTKATIVARRVFRNCAALSGFWLIIATELLFCLRG
jgi:hypothetical protein